MTDVAGRAPLDNRERFALSLQKTPDSVLELVVLVAEDQVAQALVDRIDRRLHGGAGGLLGVAGSRDPQRDRGLADGDADEGVALAGDEVWKHRFQVAFADAETLDP